jgi:cytochrome c biogenesis protein CcdA
LPWPDAGDIIFASATFWRIAVLNSFKAFLTPTILIAMTANAFALSDEAERVDLNSIVQQLIVAANLALWVSAFIGLVMTGVGVARIAAARSERRKQSPTLHYRYFEGVWRILVGLGLILVPVCATLMAPAQIA